MFLFPDSTGHPEISRRSGKFPAERTEGGKGAFSGAAFSRFRLLAGGCGGWLKGLKRLKIKKHSMNIYGAFFIFDEGNIVMLFNGFQKKTQKTPESEIEKAVKLKNEYYASKP